MLPLGLRVSLWKTVKEAEKGSESRWYWLRKAQRKVEKCYEKLWKRLSEVLKGSERLWNVLKEAEFCYERLNWRRRERLWKAQREEDTYRLWKALKEAEWGYAKLWKDLSLAMKGYIRVQPYEKGQEKLWERSKHTFFAWVTVTHSPSTVNRDGYWKDAALKESWKNFTYPVKGTVQSKLRGGS